jgi:hypothetical protein
MNKAVVQIFLLCWLFLLRQNHIIEHTPSSETYSRSSGQKIPRLS